MTGSVYVCGKVANKLKNVQVKTQWWSSKVVSKSSVLKSKWPADICNLLDIYLI